MEETFGKYLLLSRLGYGGMAEVFLARSDGIGGFAKMLAIKRLLPYYTEDEQTVELLADEAKITVRLTHPNIVQVFDFGRVDDHYFIAMEYIDGLDLKSLVEIDEHNSEPLPVDVALYVVISVLEALDYAHNRRGDDGEPLKIIHRDVSPQNVLISRHGQVKLTDFGVARAAISSHVSIIGDIRGKFSYMPPEQACGGEIDHRIDIFATGAVLYELLTGRQPFRSTSSGHQMALLQKNIKAPSEMRADLPVALDEITLKSLAFASSQRFANASAFAEALAEHLDYRGDPRGPQRRLADLVGQRLDGGQEPQPPERPAPTAAVELSSPSSRDSSPRFELPPAMLVTDPEVPTGASPADPTLETKIAIPNPRARVSDQDDLSNDATLIDQGMRRQEPGRPLVNTEVDPIDDAANSSDVALGMAPTQLMDGQDLAILPVDSLEAQETMIKRPGMGVAAAAPPEQWGVPPDDFRAAPARAPEPARPRFPVRPERQPSAPIQQRPVAQQRPARPKKQPPVTGSSLHQTAQSKRASAEPPHSAVQVYLIFGGLLLVVIAGVLLAIWVATAD